MSTSRMGLVATLLVSALACLFLTRIIAVTDWTMDADEAVHSVEALRLYDDLAAGRIGDFVSHSWMPERWHPPVNDHVRWYPPVHAWALVPFYAVLGPSDFSARLPSVLFLFGSAVLAHFLARRLAGPEAKDRDLCGFLAATLFVVSPNLLTFSAQSLIESSSLFFCLAALLVYLRSAECDHPLPQAIGAGLLLALATLTKYDHGGFLALCIGLAELSRVSFRPLAFLRSRAFLTLGIAGVVTASWFAHPDKLAALSDALSHPFYGTPRTILFDFVVTWFTEITPGLVLGLLAPLSLLALRKRHREPAVRIVLIWAVCGAAFYALRGRFHFRYHYVEAVVFLLTLAVALPVWARAIAERLKKGGRGRGVRWIGPLSVASGLAALGALFTLWSPERFFELLEGPFGWFHGLRADHWGMLLESDEYVRHFAQHYVGFVTFAAGSVLTGALAILVLSRAWKASVKSALAPERAHQVVVGCFLLACLPGVVRLYSALPRMVEWELECHPELGKLYGVIGGYVGARGDVLLGGGWDQLTNNSLRWYLLTGQEPRPPYADIEVTGDMIGSVVFPPERRIAYWTERLATAPVDELPTWIVLVDPGGFFLYHTRFGPETELYRESLERRGSHRLASTWEFEALGCTVQVWRRREDGVGSDPVDMPRVLMIDRGVLNPNPEASSREWKGEGGWSMRDESLRHFITRPE